MEYETFDLEIGKGRGPEYRASVIQSPAGSARETIVFPMELDVLKRQVLAVQDTFRPGSGLRRGRADSTDEPVVLSVGRALFDTLITGEILSAYDRSLRHAAGQNAGLRVRLSIQEPQLADLPWELLYDPRREEFLALSRNTPLERYVDVTRRRRPLVLTPPLRILVIGSEVTQDPPDPLLKERRHLEDALGTLVERGLAELIWADVRSPRDVLTVLRREVCHIVHVTGHAGYDRSAEEGLIAFGCDQPDGTLTLRATQLARLITNQASVRLVLLNTCVSKIENRAIEAPPGEPPAMSPANSLALTLVRRGVYAAVAMQLDVPERLGAEFAGTLYAALAEGESLEAAVAEARLTASLTSEDTLTWAAPVLYLCTDVERIFDIRPTTPDDQRRLAAQQASREEAVALAQTLEAERVAEYLRIFESATSIAGIAESHQGILADDLTGVASGLLRTFSGISQSVGAALQQDSSYSRRLSLNAVESRLDALVVELMRTSERQAGRYRRLAVEWRRIIVEHERELAAAVEVRQEIESPYVVALPLNEQQEIFVGRRDVGQQLERLLLAPRCPPLLLYGQRRMGKTSLLNNLGRLLPSTIVPLFVDLQGPVSSSIDHAGLLYNIALRATDSALKKRGLTLPPLTREGLSTDPFPRFDIWLDDVEAALAQNTALLIFDEFESLDRAIAQERFDEEAVLGTLRHIIQHRTRFKILLAGSHSLEEYRRWASYLINVQILHLGYLAESEARTLVETPVPDFPLRYAPDASRRVLDVTRCHPALVQILCNEIVALKNEQDPSMRRLATLADVEQAIPNALEHGDFFFTDIEVNQIDADALAVLRFMATRAEGVRTGQASLRRRFPDHLDRSIAQLLRRELIERDGRGYRFQVELIRRWFARRGGR